MRMKHADELFHARGHKIPFLLCHLSRSKQAIAGQISERAGGSQGILNYLACGAGGELRENARRNSDRNLSGICLALKSRRQ